MKLVAAMLLLLQTVAWAGGKTPNPKDFPLTFQVKKEFHLTTKIDNPTNDPMRDLVSMCTMTLQTNGVLYKVHSEALGCLTYEVGQTFQGRIHRRAIELVMSNEPGKSYVVRWPIGQTGDLP